MSSLIDIQVQIQKLQKQADEIKSKEFDKTVQEIVAKMQAFGINIKDLQAANSRSAKVKSGVRTTVKAAKGSKTGNKAKGVTVAAKYQGPNGETWSGRGLTPRWMAALVAQGREKEEFAIKH